MGLVKLAFTSINSTLHDKWDEYIRCDSIDTNDLIVKKSVKNGFNSLIRIKVLDNQTILLLSKGKVLDIGSQEGIYSFNETSKPISNLPLNRVNLDDLNLEDNIYYINTQELKDNKFGEIAKVLYHDILYKDIFLRYYGSFSFKISNPLIFFNSIINKIDNYKRNDLINEINTEFINALNLSLELCSKDGISYKNLVNSSQVIIKYLNEVLNWKDKRGLEITNVTLENVILDNDSILKINNQITNTYEEPMIINKINIVKTCPRCGSEITGKFCSECGFKIE